MPLESFKNHCNKADFGLQAKSVVLCTLNAPDFFGEKKKKKEKQATSCGTVIFLPRQRASIGIGFKLNLIGLKRRNDQCSLCHFKNSCGLENITFNKK